MVAEPQPQPGGFTGFRPLEELHQQDDHARQTRVFTPTEDTAYLRCPGLLSISRIRAGGANLPEFVDLKVPIDLSGVNFRVDRFPCWDLATGHDGVPVIRRLFCSNDGMWDKKQDVYVTGAWDLTVTPETDAPSRVPTENPQVPVIMEVGVPEGALSRGRGR